MSSKFVDRVFMTSSDSVKRGPTVAGLPEKSGKPARQLPRGGGMKRVNSSPKCDQVITQDELKRVAEYRKVINEGKKYIDNVREKFFNGATVEPGKYWVGIWSYVRIDLTIGSLRKMFGTLGGKVELLFPHRSIKNMGIYKGKRLSEEGSLVLPDDDDVLPKNISAAERQQMRSVLREAVATAFESISENHDGT